MCVRATVAGKPSRNDAMLLPPEPAPLSVSACRERKRPDRRRALKLPEPARDQPRTGLDVMSAARLGERSADLHRLVGRDQRDERRIAQAGVAGRVHRRERRRDGVDVRVLEPERGAEILPVVERQRLDVAVHVADPEFRHERRTVDVQVVRLEAVGLGGVRPGERVRCCRPAGCRSPPGSAPGVNVSTLL